MTACSVGRKSVTSPALGLSVPTTAITSSGQNAVTLAKPTPVAIISAVAREQDRSRTDAIGREPGDDRQQRPSRRASR